MQETQRRWVFLSVLSLACGSGKGPADVTRGVGSSAPAGEGSSEGSGAPASGEPRSGEPLGGAAAPASMGLPESGVAGTEIRNVGTGGGGSLGEQPGSTPGGPPVAAAATCSDPVLRTAPPPGREAFKADPIDATFPFSTHWMGEFSDDPRFIGMTSFADLDHDGDLDFASGQREDLGGGVMWWEYCSPDHWVRHFVGTGHRSWAGGNAADLDGDGWVDLIAGDSWYKNPQDPRAQTWQRFATGGPKPEEIIVGEVSGDQSPDVLYIHRSFRPQVWSPGADPEAVWTRSAELANAQQQGGAIGDLDGDGDNDILVGYRWWYRNVAGDGSAWETVTIFDAGFDNEPLTYLGDLDGDGDTDFVMGTHFGARLAWAENEDGVGTQFALHLLASDKAYLHSIVAADFDNDGDLDLLAGQNVGPSFIFENADGRGTFVEHTIAADTRSHDSRVADVDCDGDLDIAGTPWGDQREGGEDVLPAPLRDHVYLRNLLVENGGTPLFRRQPYEVFLGAEGRVCPE